MKIPFFKVFQGPGGPGIGWGLVLERRQNDRSDFFGLNTLGNIVFYPNPVNNILYVDYEGSMKNISYRLYNLQGRLIKQDIVNSGSIDLSGIENGVYMLKLELDGVMKTIRIIKNSL